LWRNERLTVVQESICKSSGVSKMINQAMIIGNLGSDPKASAIPNGSIVVNFNVATSEKFKDKNGQQQEQTEWHRIVAFGRLAEICEQYLKKGSQVYIEGRLQTRQWEDKNGNKQYTTEIVAKEMKMLGTRDEKPSSTQHNKEIVNSATDKESDFSKIPPPF
jgi:single-strand DNA-binding protein